MTSTSKRFAQAGGFAIALALSFRACSTVMAAESLCGVEFDPVAIGFAVEPVGQDEASGCGRFLKGEESRTAGRPTVSIVVLDGPASSALKSMPSNFVVAKGGALHFKTPRPVNDSRRFYFVRPLGTLTEKKLSMPDSTIYFAEHKRRVERLEKINDREEVEVTESQRCVDAVRTSATVTVILSGCDLAKNGAALSRRLLPMLRTATLPASVSFQPQGK